MNNEGKDSFMEPKTIVAIVLVALSWFAWDFYMRNKYPHIYKKTNQAQRQEQDSSSQNSKLTIPSHSSHLQEGGIHGHAYQKKGLKINPNSSSDVSEIQKAEIFHKYEGKRFSFVITSKGMGLRDVVLKEYMNREGNPMRLGSSQGFSLFETNLIGKTSKIDFYVKKIGDNKFIGEAFDESIKFVKTFSINPENYTIDINVEVSDITVNFLGLTTYISAPIETQKEQSFLVPSFGGQEIFIFNSDGQERTLVSDMEETPTHYQKILVAALGSQYFAQAILDKSDVMPSASFFKEFGSVIGRLNHSVLSRSSDFSIHFSGFIGPKSTEVLGDLALSNLVDFGWFHWIGKILLKIMKIFHSFTGNWGLSIIAMTLLVRLFLLPLNVFSYESMKKMQIIQPLIKEIREVHKEDPQRMNREVMALMKKNKANPISGCLPMLLQFPIFIALYRVLGQSIELYQSPFFLWIQDLSLKDPFYILPILMGLAMFLQMAIQPNTMEPAQRKIMMFMPVMFTFFMLSLPSGLTLYILVSTVFGILQHLYFMKKREVIAVMT